MLLYLRNPLLLFTTITTTTTTTTFCGVQEKQTYLFITLDTVAFHVNMKGCSS